ncbi:MAG TPA: hypothetical protein VGG06_34440 [Thermoanaerobaculia bacterium]
MIDFVSRRALAPRSTVARSAAGAAGPGEPGDGGGARLLPFAGRRRANPYDRAFAGAR